MLKHQGEAHDGAVRCEFDGAHGQQGQLAAADLAVSAAAAPEVIVYLRGGTPGNRESEL